MDGDLEESELTELCRAYWAYHRARCAGDEREAERHLWAWERVDAIGSGRPGTEPIDRVRILSALAEAAGDDQQALAFLGAGPVEDCLNRGRPDRERLEAAALRSDRLRRAIGYAR